MPMPIDKQAMCQFLIYLNSVAYAFVARDGVRWRYKVLFIFGHCIVRSKSVFMSYRESR